MSKADRNNSTSRRALLGAAAAVPLAALPMAAVAGSLGGDAEMIRLAAAILANHAEGDRLVNEEDSTKSRARRGELRERIKVLAREGWDMRAELAAMPATTPAGLRAKARIVRAFSNCFDGADPYDDDALAWSVANDLLGIASRFMTEEEQTARSQLPPPPTFREQFPAYQRAPDDLDAWLAQAEEDYAVLGLVPAIQAREGAERMAFPELSAAELDALYERLAAVHDRLEARAKALHGALIQVGVARLRAAHPELEGVA